LRKCAYSLFSLDLSTSSVQRRHHQLLSYRTD
jgi:hypothetical protein